MPAYISYSNSISLEYSFDEDELKIMEEFGPFIWNEKFLSLIFLTIPTIQPIIILDECM